MISNRHQASGVKSESTLEKKAIITARPIKRGRMKAKMITLKPPNILPSKSLKARHLVGQRELQGPSFFLPAYRIVGEQDDEKR